MQKCRVCAVFIAIAVILPALFCSCATKPEMTQEASEKMYELADILGADLSEKILPKRNDPAYLTEYNYVISDKGKSQGTETLALFFADYKTESDCEVTLISTDGSFVVSRIAFVNGVGYYLRYEYSEEKPKSYEVRGHTITKVDLEYQEKTMKWIFTLYDGNKQRASFAING